MSHGSTSTLALIGATAFVFWLGAGLAAAEDAADEFDATPPQGANSETVLPESPSAAPDVEAVTTTADAAENGTSESASDVIVPSMEAAGRFPTLFPVPDYGGDERSRDRAFGDWGGRRPIWAEHGLQFELDLAQTVQAVTSGGRDKETQYDGTLDYVLKLDAEKLVGWPGASLLIRGRTLFGKTVNLDTGSIVASNYDGLFPTGDQDETILADVALVQFVHSKLGIVVGRLSTLDSDANVFAHGRGRTHFQNLALNVNPVTLRTVPYLGLGAGLVAFPRDGLTLQFLALDAEGSPTDDGFDSVFEGGTSFVFEGRLETSFFGFEGHQLLGATYSDRNFVSVAQDPRILVNRVPGSVGAVPRDREDDSWSVYWNFDQYLWQASDDSGRGVGLFGRAGFADKDANPIEWFVSIGVGAQGMVRGRESDSFGIGFFVVGASDEFPAFVDVDAAEGVEFYYNIAVTEWLDITPDIQIVEPAAEDLDQAVILGIRTLIEF